LHPPFGCFKLQHQLTGPVIKGLVEFVHHIQQLLDGLHELGEDWDVHTEGSKSGHFCQCSWVFQSVQGLLHGEIEWCISGKDFKIIIVDARHCDWWVLVHKYFSCKLLASISLHSHLIWNAIEHPIMQVGALDILSVTLLGGYKVV